jgi:CO dehydrogenase maturation factor
MKIAVSGKGGVGKTFIAGTLAALFVRSGHRVIALDADPSPNLAQTLGLSFDEAARIVPIAENEQLIRLKTGTEFSGVFRLTFTVDDIIDSYSVPTPAGPHLMVMGTVRSMGAGCTCPANSVVKALLRHLVVERDEVVILDMEAGIEHLGRGTAEHVDTMIVVTDANRKSLEIARTICQLAAESNIHRIGLVGNRITESLQENAIRFFAEKNQLNIFTMIPFDQQVADAGITGVEVDEKTSLALPAIGQLADILTNNDDVVTYARTSKETTKF